MRSFDLRLIRNNYFTNNYHDCQVKNGVNYDMFFRKGKRVSVRFLQNDREVLSNMVFHMVCGKRKKCEKSQKKHLHF